MTIVSQIIGAPSRVAKLTGPSESAIAVYRFMGEQSIELVNESLQLRGSRPVQAMELGRIYYGFWSHHLSDGFREDVVACRTESECVEVHFHGSLAISESIRSCAVNRGIDWISESQQSLRNVERMVPDSGEANVWDKLDEICSLNLGGDDLAVPPRDRFQRLLSSTLTKITAPEPAESLLLQANGILERRIAQIAECLDRPAEAVELVRELRATWTYGQFLQRPVVVLLTGEPNVGKSSLINSLLGYSRSIVTPVAGTTRDLVTQDTIIDGWSFRLIDSAGVRESTDELETVWIAKVTAALLTADLVIEVQSAEEIRLSEPVKVSRSIDMNEQRNGRIRVLNKVDLLSAEDPVTNELTRKWSESGSPILTSTTTGVGIRELLHRISAAAGERMHRPAHWKELPLVFDVQFEGWLQRLQQTLERATT